MTKEQLKDKEFDLNHRIVLFEEKLEKQVNELSEASFFIGYTKAIQHHSNKYKFFNDWFKMVIGKSNLKPKKILLNPNFIFDAGLNGFTLMENGIELLMSPYVPYRHFLLDDN